MYHMDDLLTNWLRPSEPKHAIQSNICVTAILESTANTSQLGPSDTQLWCVCVCVCVCACVCVCVFMSVCVCMCVYMCVHARALGVGNTDILIYDYCKAKISQLS